MTGRFVPLLLALACACGKNDAPRTVVIANVEGPDSCVGCHETRQPGVLKQWHLSAHAREGVACTDCHGNDHDAMFRAKGMVPASACKECHPKETVTFRKSVHGRAMADAAGNARLLMQIPAMQRLGCMGCHSTGGPDPTRDDDGHCNACHGAHRYSVEEARLPESCGLCHRGPDHPHIEAFEASRHGVAWLATHDDEIAPTCVTCHMDGNDHDFSAGLTIGRAGSGAVLEGEQPPVPMKVFSEKRVAKERGKMIARCLPCHTPRVARRALEDADAIKREADRLLGEAVRIVERLHADRLLDPMPDERVGHPTRGHALVLGGPALYENHSDAERIFFDLAKFAHAITFKGAYHLSPDHTHWLGIARLKASIEELRAEERRLRAAR
jgi:hypothetical protein